MSAPTRKRPGRRAPAILALGPALALAGTAAGQTTAPKKAMPTAQAPAEKPGTKAKPAEPPKTEVRVHTEAASRRAFAECDGDADDRLSIFEATRAFEDMGSPRDSETFRTVDTDRDGFLSWPEFDQRLQTVIRLRGSLRYRPARKLSPADGAATPPPKDDSIDRSLLAVLDADRSGAVSRDEFANALQAGALSPALRGVFPSLDADDDGQLASAELAAMRVLLPKLVRPEPVGNSPQAFPAEFAEVDRNRDGLIDELELDRALRQIHPSLGRWTQRVLADADRSGNHVLGPAEVLALQPPPDRDR
jgi:Ca2+-binding EF-hand superfamily protein